MKALVALAAAALIAVTSTIGHAQDQQVYTKNDGVTLPTVVKMVRPEYTKDAMQLGIQGAVILSTVVRADGSVTDVRVVRSLDMEYGLDEAAVEALKASQFRPGTKDGKAVAVRIECEMKFTLK